MGKLKHENLSNLSTFFQGDSNNPSPNINLANSLEFSTSSNHQVSPPIPSIISTSSISPQHVKRCGTSNISAMEKHSLRSTVTDDLQLKHTIYKESYPLEKQISLCDKLQMKSSDELQKLADELLAFPLYDEYLQRYSKRHPSLIVRCNSTGTLQVPGRIGDESLIFIYGFPRTDDDVEEYFSFVHIPGISVENFRALQSQLMEHLHEARASAVRQAHEIESIITNRISALPISLQEIDKTFKELTNLFIVQRNDLVKKFDAYFKMRRWIENFTSRQRLGCYTVKQKNMLRVWMFDNFANPYPSENDKQMLQTTTGLSMEQINNWLINARARHWKPLVDVLLGKSLRKRLSSKRMLKQMEERDDGNISNDSQTSNNGADGMGTCKKRRRR